MIQRFISLGCALAGVFLLGLTAGCGTARLAGGTETQNPQVVACVNKMARTAFDAADVGDSWRPAYYLADSTRAALSRKLPKRLTASSADSSSLLIAGGPPDTMIIGDSSMVIRDTVLIRLTVVRPETLLINKTIFVADTVTDTFRTSAGSGIRTSILMRSVVDSILIRDTVVILDTVEHFYKRVISSVQSSFRGASGGATTVQADTDMIDLGVTYEASATPSITDGKFADASVLKSWQVAEISFVPASLSLSYRIISSPTKDTLVVVPGPDALNIRNNQNFIASSTFDGGILVETIHFDAIDSMLSIVRFNPSPFDTVESLTVNYSIDQGTNKYSGTDDRLLGFGRSCRYRLGTIHHLDLSVAPHATMSLDGSNEKSRYSGMIAVRLSLSDNRSGEFSGTVDTVMGLYGVFELDGKKYQVNCDRLYKTTIVEMTR